MQGQATARRGIAAGGNWIVDRIKTVDRLPGRGMLASILAERLAVGGGPCNVLSDLARLKAPFPLWGFGVVGNDEDGRVLRRTLAPLSIDIGGLAIAPDARTSYTDVMTERDSGERTFYHHRGANALFDPGRVTALRLPGRIFHLAYLLLLDAVDQPDAECGTVAARLLRDLRAAGWRTSVDVVSEDGDRFRTVVPPALAHTDYLILNEIEAGRVVGLDVRAPAGALDAAALAEAVERLFALGVRELVAVHMPEGAYLGDRAGGRWSVGSLQLPPGFIRGAVGAGDAFCAGMLYGLHEQWDVARAARFGSCCAAACLSQEGATEGLGPLAEVEALGRRFPEREPPVKL